MTIRDIVAKHSYQELLNLLHWFHHQGPIPVIIGGWAVYAYNSYLGSVDIDLVGPSTGGLFDATIEAYERERGYQALTTGPLYLGTSFRKPIYDSNEIVGYMEIDACTYENDHPKTFHEDPKKELPYSLCQRSHLTTNIQFNKNCEAKIPNKTLRLLYKLKALRDRQYDLEEKSGILGIERLAWLRSKIIKDGSDLISLIYLNPQTSIIRQEIETKILKEIIEEFRLEFCIESISKLSSMELSCQQYRNINSATVKEWTSKLLNEIK